jgi:predicted dehydrogenase
MNRRGFLFTAASAARVWGANEKVRLGLIGCGGRGRYVTKFMTSIPDAELAAAADVSLPGAEAMGVPAYQDFRKLLERKDVDAVVVATPDHWHAGVTVLACEAGKAVYVEKPVSYSVLEGRAMVDAARRYKRLVQAGTQQRSAPHFMEAAEIVRSGQLGAVHFVRVWNYTNRAAIGWTPVPDSEPPAGLDWDMYCGPAPKAPYNLRRWKASFRMYRDYAGGTITDFGTHRFDTVHEIMGVDRPRTIAASGGRFDTSIIGDQPDMLQVTYEYEGFVMSYEAYDLNSHGLGGRRPGMVYYGAKGTEDRPNGMAFYGSNGALFADRLGYEIYPEKGKLASKQVQGRDATDEHAKHFIACVQGKAKTRADIEIGHRATTVGLLGNIAYRTGLKLHWDAEREQFADAPEAEAQLWREPRKPWDLVPRPR